MNKKVILAICSILIIISIILIYGYLQFSNNRLNKYSDKVLSVASNTRNSIYFLLEKPISKEKFISDTKELVSNLYALEIVLSSGSILLTGDNLDSNRFYFRSEALMKELKYINMNEETIQDLNTIASASDILIKRFLPYSGTEDTITKKEIIEAIEEALAEMRKLNYIILNQTLFYLNVDDYNFFTKVYGGNKYC